MSAAAETPAQKQLFLLRLAGEIAVKGRGTRLHFLHRLQGNLESALASTGVPYKIERDWSRFVTPARVTIEFRDGQSAEARVDYPKGHPRNPMTQAQFAAKTRDCAVLAARELPADTAARLIATVGRLETLAGIANLLRVIA